MEVIAIKQLSKSYGATCVLESLSLQYESGKIYGLVGENGAGKTTLFNCILGLTPHQGTIFRKPGLSIGYLPAELYFYTLVTGREYLEFCLRAKGKKLDKEQLEAMNGDFHLPLHRYASEYSTGMKKKLALMALLLQDNDVYILDESFNGVDLYGCIRLKSLIRSLKENGKTVLLSSHLVPVLHELCDSIDYLSNRTIVKRFTEESAEEIEVEIMKQMGLAVSVRVTKNM